MGSSNNIHLVIVTDEHYVIMLAALLKSIETNHKSGEKINVYIIEEKVKQSSKRKLEASIDASMFSLSWLKMEDTIPAGVKLPLDRTSFPLIAYMRLFIPTFIPKDADKALFLDVDMIVQEDISNLWNIDLGDKVIGAVQDPRLLTFDNNWGGVFNYKELGFAPDTKYFNSGLMVMNTKKWLELNMAQKVIDIINQNIKYANYPDQYGLNVALANQWLELDTRWNYFASGDLEKPFIIHFTSRKPFYTTYSNNPAYQRIFYHYLNMTGWKGAKPIGEAKRYAKKINNVLVKVKKLFKQ